MIDFITYLPEEYIVEVNSNPQNLIKKAFEDCTGYHPHGNYNYYIISKNKYTGGFYEHKESIPDKHKNLPIIAFKNWVELYNKQNNKQMATITTEPRKVKGYKFKGSNIPSYFNHTNIMQNNFKNYGWHIAYDSLIAKDLRLSGVLNVLFDEVYEEDNITHEVNRVKLVINKNGLIQFDFNSNKGTTSIEILSGILAHNKFKNKIGEFEVKCSRIHIGCSSGVELSIDDLEKIVRLYNAKYKV